ncbi:MAG TPA: DoxX family protein [Moraxellaceae bacterium]|nr:DoxX family protein [Moraxellaceae bacterium]
MSSSLFLHDRWSERIGRAQTHAHRLLTFLGPVGPLLLRLWLAQEFVQAGWIKLSGGWSAPDWFAMLSFPVPVRWLPADVNWVTAGLLEITLGSLLLIGLFGRLASLGLLFVTWVAVYSVHFDLGWAGWNQIETAAGQGFKVPLMLALMLGVLLLGGMGRWSVDGWWRQRCASPS